MSVFEYKDGFRPRDNSVSTKLKYEGEARHWDNAFKSIQARRPMPIGKDFGVIGILFSLVFSLITLIVILVIDFMKFVRS